MTTFKIAITADDYKKCHALLDLLGRAERSELSFPTIMAFRDDNLVAFVSTVNPKKAKAIIIGELAISPYIKRPQFILVKIIDIWERFMYDRGIVSYLFYIPLDKQEWIAMMEKVTGLTPYTKDSKLAWYNRKIAPPVRKVA